MPVCVFVNVSIQFLSVMGLPCLDSASNLAMEISPPDESVRVKLSRLGLSNWSSSGTRPLEEALTSTLRRP